MKSERPLNTVVATYRVRPGKEEAFLELLRGHHPLLRRLGLVTHDAPTIYCGREDDGRPIVFEIFTWKDAQAPEVAHETPELMRIWDAMGELVEERDGKPSWEFPHVERLDLGSA